MKKVMLTIAVAIAFGVIGFAFNESATEVQANSVTSNDFFGDTCQNVKFKLVNKHSKGGDIEIRGVKYYNKANGKWQTEDLPNVVVKQGSTLTTGGDDLRDSEGESLTKFIFIYRWKSSGRSANWSGEVNSREFTPDTSTCNANRTYGSTSWIIG